MQLKIANEKLSNKIKRIARKDKKHAEALYKAFDKLIENPYCGKPLKHELKGNYLIHVYSSFVLIYELKEDVNTIVILEYAHHDDAY
ncbi:addiction module RelE/StbE family toxin [Methanococcus voltae PS]|uniref:Addiction module RelE/StbE family toxin n=1 Tax=Methanococcus voltae PS TaxID=523842 RepID=A0ABT2EVW5_METVO|nr:type II toxin-antitoxin system mRNA interferase toxin, RelE/StbE family [Methanococcus voltae]MCS3921990.1 addiction module RelE/StbE family toxin [Methanococcus voltae PS]